jgi:hypothetical protein
MSHEHVHHEPEDAAPSTSKELPKHHEHKRNCEHKPEHERRARAQDTNQSTTTTKLRTLLPRAREIPRRLEGDHERRGLELWGMLIGGEAGEVVAFGSCVREPSLLFLFGGLFLPLFALLLRPLVHVHEKGELQNPNRRFCVSLSPSDHSVLVPWSCSERLFFVKKGRWKPLDRVFSEGGTH